MSAYVSLNTEHIRNALADLSESVIVAGCILDEVTATTAPDHPQARIGVPTPIDTDYLFKFAQPSRTLTPADLKEEREAQLATYDSVQQLLVQHKADFGKLQSSLANHIHRIQETSKDNVSETKPDAVNSNLAQLAEKKAALLKVC